MSSHESLPFFQAESWDCRQRLPKAGVGEYRQLPAGGPKKSPLATRRHSPSLAFSNEDSRFDRTMDMRTGYFTRSMIVAGALGEAEIS